MTSFCNICCNDRNQAMMVICPKCSEEACITCYKKTMLSSTENAQCLFPGCRTYFTLEFLIKKFGSDFIWSNKAGNYRRHRENMLLEQQKVLLPDTQIIVERENKIKQYDIKMDRLKKEIQKLYDEQYALKYPNKVKNIQLLEDDPIKCNCPKQNCNGFISLKWACGICSSKICSKCLDIYGLETDPNIAQLKEDHICNEDSVKNVEEIRKSTKPCPKCKVSVFKISGCHQMFCTICKTFFDWSSLKIIEKTNFVHNPHYTEWLQNGGNAEDMIITGPTCDITYPRIRNATKDKKRYDLLVIFNQILNNLRYETMIDLDQKLEKKLLEHRKDFLVGLLTNDEFKKLIQQNYKKFQKDSEYKDIQIASVEYFNSAFLLYLTDIENKKYSEEEAFVIFINRILKYYKYAMESIAKMFKLYNSKAFVELDTSSHQNCSSKIITAFENYLNPVYGPMTKEEHDFRHADNRYLAGGRGMVRDHATGRWVTIPP